MNTNRLINSTTFRYPANRSSIKIDLTSSTSNNVILRAPTGRLPKRPHLTESLQAGALQESGKRFRRILVPLDGTPFAEHAIPLAVGVAEQCNAVLQLVHVLVPTDVVQPYEFLHAADAKLKEHENRLYKYLSETAQRISAATSIGVTSAVINGLEVTDALHETYGSSSDLIVMTTHGRGALGRFWWGSVAHTLLQRTKVPIILVPRSDERPSFMPRPIKHVVLPLGCDQPTEQAAVESMLRLGIFANANHTLLHVIRPEPKLVPQGDSLRTEWVPSHSREVAAMEYLRPVADLLRERGRSVRTKVVSSEKPLCYVVSRHARHAERDLIACTYRRARLLERLVWPGLSERLFRAAACPLMLVPR